jgi:predicted transcriptional regulator
MNQQEHLIELTAGVVSAHVSNNSVAVSDLPTLINNVFTSLAGLGATPEPEVVAPEPAVSIRQSVKPDFIVCLEDGKKLKMLKRHLMTHYQMTPDDYRAKWGLPADYPMVAPNYAEQRRALAKSIGLGNKRADAVETAPAAQEEASKPAKVTRARKTTTAPATASEAAPAAAPEASVASEAQAEDPGAARVAAVEASVNPEPTPEPSPVIVPEPAPEQVGELVETEA